MTFEEFKETVFKEPFDGGKYIVNGDTQISTEAQLIEFFARMVETTSAPTTGLKFFARMVETTSAPTTELTVNQVNGQDAIWDSSIKSVLTNCVSTTFGNNHTPVVTPMNDAAAAWEGPADLDFIHVSAEDTNCTAANNNVLFDVRPVNFGAFLSRAFFRGDARTQRNVLIDNSAFTVTGNLTLTGILRHELGHTVGFRHEHTRPDSGTCFEDNDWRGVTDYDAFSVMHYPQCNGLGDWSLTLTTLDKNGAACIYGPAPGFTNDPTICMHTNADSGGPVAYVVGNDNANVYARGSGGHLWHWWFANGWHQEDLGGNIAGTPAAYVVGDDNANVYARGSDGHLWHWWYADGWHQEDLGGNIAGTPAAYVVGDDNANVYARGSDGRLWHWWYADGWHQEDLGGA